MAMMVLAVSAGVARAEILRKTDGTELKGVRIKWFETRQEYQVEGADGSMIPVAADQVDSLEITKPAEFDKAAQDFAAKRYDQAIPVLEDLATRYKRLQWDGRARELLANAYFAKSDFKKAAQVMGDLMENTPKHQITEEQYALYWKGLMGAQMTGVLKKSLNDAIDGDSKVLASLATVYRGDLNKAEGKREDAVLDYLRAVLLYEEALSVHPEALYKAAQLLDEMRDGRADELRKKLMSLYPNSSYARKLGG
jgi:outer membrane protein assembly factor BamD (BamD/ComL family)